MRRPHAAWQAADWPCKCVCEGFDVDFLHECCWKRNLNHLLILQMHSHFVQSSESVDGRVIYICHFWSLTHFRLLSL